MKSPEIRFWSKIELDKLEEFDIVSHSIMMVDRDDFDNRQIPKLKYAS